MAGALNGLRVAILAADGGERVELEQPRQALDDAGARTVVISISSGEIEARNDLEDAGTFPVDRLVDQVSVEDYDAPAAPLRPQHGHRYIPEILDRMSRDEVRTEHLATHVKPNEDGPEGYRMFKDKEDGCVRAVFCPGA